MGCRTGIAALTVGSALAVAVHADAPRPGRGTVELVHAGKPRAIVIIAENPTRPAHVAAKEFIHYVAKMTGVELPLYVDGVAPKQSWAPRRVYIGESSFTRDMGLRSADFASQEYLVETRGQELILMGRDADEYGIISYVKNGLWPTAGRARNVLYTPMGTLYAVHTFLEKYCGMRWYLPGELGEVCPRHGRLLVSNIHLRTKPWTRYRNSSRHSYRDPFRFYGHADPDKLVRVPSRDMVLWMLRMKIGGSRFACNHSFNGYPERFGETHPEWWKEGKRTSAWPHPDYANPALIEQATQDALDYFGGKRPDGRRGFAGGDYFAVMPNDGRKGLIWSEAGEALRNNDPAVQDGFSCGWASDFVFNMVRQVAGRVGAQYPDKFITCAAYAPYFNPPRDVENFPQNVAIQHCGFLHRSFTPEKWDYEADNLRAWSKLAKELYVWEYYLVQSESKFKAFPVVYPRQVARAIQCMHDVGVKGMFFEASAAPSASGRFTDATLANPAEDLLNHYVTWKMLCDASLDVEKLLAEHYRLFYGPAEDPMREFFTLVEQRWTDPDAWAQEGLRTRERSWRVLCPPDVLHRLEQYIRAALAAATSEPYRTRVDLVYRAVYKRMERNAMAFRHKLAARRRLGCPRVADAPRLDGVLQDPAWENAPATRPFVSVNALPGTLDATARVVRDATNLYVAFEIDRPAVGTVRDDAGLPAASGTTVEDYVELAFDAGRGPGRTHHVRVGLDGVVRDWTSEAGREDAAWVSAAEAAVTGGKEVATAELRVPLAALGVTNIAPGDVWGINFARRLAAIDPQGEEPALTMWSPAFGAFATSADFGVLDPACSRDDGAADRPPPVVHYDFEDLGDGRVVPDRAGALTEGARVPSNARLKVAREGAPWTAESLVEGQAGRALRFGGTAAKQYLELALAPSVNLAYDDFTIAFFFKAERPAGVLLHSTTSSPYWGLYFTEGPRLRLALNSGGEHKTSVGQSAALAQLGDGQWHRLVLTVDRGRDARVYLDGERVITHSIRGQRGRLKQVLTIGGPYNYFEGAVDEFRIFPGSISEADIDAL